MPPPGHRVVVALSPGMPIFEASVPCEVFGIDRPELAAPWYDFAVVGVGDEPVRLAAGFRLDDGRTAAQRTRLLARAETLVVPACANVHENPPAELVAAVRAARRRGARLVSICSGAFVLAAAGVLDGRRATTHWMHAEELAARYPAVEVDPSVLYTDDDNIVTSAGTAAGLDACLHVVRRDHGATVAAELARRLVVPPHREGGQSQFSRTPTAVAMDNDQWLADVLAWIDSELHRPLVTAELAERARVSVRTLERRFRDRLGMSPLQWQVQQRLRRAQEMLEVTDQPIEMIVSACGFGTAASMRMHFARSVGLSPSAYRRTFHSADEAARTA